MIRYDSFDEIILYNWIKCNEGKLHFTRVSQPGDFLNWWNHTWIYRFWMFVTFSRAYKKNAKLDKIAWENIYAGFRKKIPLNQDFEDYLDLLEERFNCQYEFITSCREGEESKPRNRFLLNRIKLLNANIKSAERLFRKAQSMNTVLNQLGKIQGHYINIKEYTAAQYFQLIEDNSKSSTKDDSDEQAD